MKRNRAIVIIIAACMSALLAACSGGGAQDAQAAAETQAEQGTQAATEVQTEQIVEETTTAAGEYAEYVGHTFGGTDPWEGELAVSIANVENGKMEWSFADSFEEITLFQELQGTEIKDGVAEFTLNAKGVENESISCDYAGTLELKDGKIYMTFNTGAVLVESFEGGYSARMAEALADSGLSSTVELTSLPDIQ